MGGAYLSTQHLLIDVSTILTVRKPRQKRAPILTKKNPLYNGLSGNNQEISPQDVDISL